MDQRERLRSAREAKGLTQADLAELLGLPQSRVGRWEAKDPSKRVEPSLSTALRIARALDTSVEELFGETEA